jgi:hypothetical protein
MEKEYISLSCVLPKSNRQKYVTSVTILWPTPDKYDPLFSAKPRLNRSNKLVEQGKNLTPVPSTRATGQAGHSGTGREGEEKKCKICIYTSTMACIQVHLG